MLSLFTVAATALGTLFFVDASHVGNIHGLDAVGVLILVWNAGFVALMAALILITAKDDIKKFAQWAVAKCKSMLPSGTGTQKCGGGCQRRKLMSLWTEQPVLASNWRLSLCQIPVHQWLSHHGDRAIRPGRPAQ